MGCTTASTADAIAETPVAQWWFNRGAIYARPVFLEEEEEMERTELVVNGVKDHAYFHPEEGRNYYPLNAGMKAALARAGYRIDWDPKKRRTTLTSPAAPKQASSPRGM